MIIRQETIQDHAKVYQLIQEAFASAEHADGNEQDLVVALRKGDAYIPELSLVAEINNEIVGHIMFTKDKVGENTVLILAPLSVKPNFQRKGIGTALINQGHEIAKKLGYSYSLVLGSKHYYPKFGYIPAKEFGLEVPDGIPSINFMAIKLIVEAAPIQGAVTYPKEFGI